MSFTGVFALLTVMSLAQPVLAETPAGTPSPDNSGGTSSVSGAPAGNSGSVRANVENLGEADLRQQLSLTENKAHLACEAKIVSCVSSGASTEVLMRAARVSGVGAGTIQVSLFGLTYTINVATSTRLVRRAWLGSSLDEISAGDIVNVYGFLDSQNNFLVNAVTVRNLSVAPSQNSWKGTVASMNSGANSFVLNVASGTPVTAQLSSVTQIVVGGFVCKEDGCDSKNGHTGTLADIAVGAPVVVRGVLRTDGVTVDAHVVLVGGANDTRGFFGETPGKAVSSGTPEGQSAAQGQINTLQQRLLDIFKRLNNSNQ